MIAVIIISTRSCKAYLSLVDSRSQCAIYNWGVCLHVLTQHISPFLSPNKVWPAHAHVWSLGSVSQFANCNNLPVCTFCVSDVTFEDIFVCGRHDVADAWSPIHHLFCLNKCLFYYSELISCLLFPFFSLDNKDNPLKKNIVCFVTLLIVHCCLHKVSKPRQRRWIAVFLI